MEFEINLQHSWESVTQHQYVDSVECSGFPCLKGDISGLWGQQALIYKVVYDINNLHF